MKPVILCFLNHYIPGYRSGGPVRTIANFVDWLGSDFDIMIVTSDRDMGDVTAYPNVRTDCWNVVGNARVYYTSKKSLNLLGIVKIINSTHYDILYLNSFLSFSFTVLPLLARKLRLVPCSPCILAPRGEFSPGALSLDPLKKSFYLFFSKLTRCYSNLTWQVSSDLELYQVAKYYPLSRNKFVVVPDLPACPNSNSITFSPKLCLTKSESLRIIFLSRISPVKNLDYLLASLSSITASISLSIYGPISDVSYWRHCLSLIDELPTNVRVDYLGEVHPTDVLPTFSKHDLFVLPTLGENFGHVILESLSAGTPVLLSDQTLWNSSDNYAIKTLPLSNIELWTATIEERASFSANDLSRSRRDAYDFAKQYLLDSNVLVSNRELFFDCLGIP